ncbi:MAG TPA: SUMF1/EgtB/PvdO family nonheme iron enzyme [Pirellulales bacterium]|nr:SUMF1/EgtB/PvdO family nonheme iron enzyme [Pirellulales bacterium]
MNAARNLLFGILAFQNSFIDRRALLAAFDQWTSDKNKPLGEILVELGNLDVSRRQLLDALVAEHLKQHGNDAEKSLAAVSSVGSVRKDLERIADPDVRASLAGAAAQPPDGDAPVDPYATITPSAGTRTSSGMRFTILRAHKKGGLGQVSVALDEELNREVAFKEIQDKYADHPDSRSRFLLEAEVTGGLEHPGIVPVYGLGQYADGRPFYAMRFIRGDSLQDAIKRFHDAQASGGRKPPVSVASGGRQPPVSVASGGRKPPVSLIGERAVQFRKLLGRFIDVCNAIDYAHSRGVLHRDLKPGNIMLGKFGETLVVDWGLAKPLGHRDSTTESGERTLQPSSASGPALTQMGSAIGTPQYMSPEQAEGRLDLLGCASDVYSLGATLYCLLTGRPPFESGELADTLDNVAKGNFPPPRKVKHDVPPALQAICLKAMALKPSDRYASARALADDIERWIADEPILVYREPLRRRVRRWVRNHKGTAGAAAAAIVVLVVGGIVASAIGQRAHERTRAQALVESLANADTQQVPAMVAQLGQYEKLTRPLLAEKLAQAKDGSTEKLHLSLALVAGDERQVEYLYQQLLGAEPARFAVIRDALANHSPRISDRLWTVLTGRESDPNQQRLRAAGALAKYDPANAQWPEVAPEVANQLVSVNPVFVGQWQEALRPVAEKLLPSLAKIFNDPEQGELPRTLATSLLADYAKGDPDTLTKLIIDADSKAFGTVFPVLQSHGAAAVEKLQAVLDRKVEPTWNDLPLDRSHHAPRDGSITRSVMSTVETAHGMVDERFAFCQDLAWEEFRQLAESLRPSGYRPTRVRPWRTDDKLLVAAVWTRDGRRWELETDLGQDQLPQSDAPAAKDGLVPADLAVLPSVDPAAEPPGVSGGGRRFVLLWGEPAAAGEERRIVVGAGEQELLASQAALVKQGFAAQSAVGVWTDAAGQRRYLGIWSNQGAPSELRAAYGGFELVDQPQWDVAVAPAARLADPLDARRRQLAEIAKLPPAQLDQPQWRLTRATAQYHVGQLEAALADLDFLVEKKVASPELPQYRAWTLARLGKAEEARAELAKYLEQAKDPSTRAYVQVVLAAWLGEHDQAAELLDGAAKAAAANADGLYNAACAAAMASQACAASDAPRAAALQGRAIELLEAAVAQGYTNSAQLRTDVDLAGLHGEARFLALIDRLEPPARYAAVWRADVEFESRLLGPSSLESQLDQARELAAHGYRPVAIVAFDERTVAGLARVRDAQATPDAGILANPATAGILANPATAGILANPATAGILANPATAGILANPATAGILANPATVGILANPATVGILANPATVGILTNSATPQSAIRDPQSAILTTSVWHRPLVPSAAKVALAKRQAGAAAALLRQGAREKIFSVLRVTDDLESLTQFVHRCRERGVTAVELCDCVRIAEQRRRTLRGEPRRLEDRVLFGLLLALGDYGLAEVPETQRDAFVEQLANWYGGDPSSSIHGATGWLLRHWKRGDLAKKVDQTPLPYAPGREWFTLEFVVPPSGGAWASGGRQPPVHSASDGRQPPVNSSSESPAQPGTTEPPEGGTTNGPATNFHITFVVFPAGEYLIGSAPDEVDRHADERRHAVKLTRPIAVSDREITWEQYNSFDHRGHHDSWEKQFGRTLTLEEPAFGVNWYEAVSYCRWLSERAGMSEEDQAYPAPSSLDPGRFPADPDPQAGGAPRNWPLNLEKPGFRLPTEAEWEMVCRGGTSTAYSFGNDAPLLRHYGWFQENSEKWSHAVGLLRPSPRGLFDIHGNLYEWCHDWYGDYGNDAADPVGGATGSGRVIRGGGWNLVSAFCRAAFREASRPTVRIIYLGFRLAVVPFSQASESASRAASDAGSGSREAEGVAAERRSPADQAEATGGASGDE